jgi:superfamily II DNA or RNA helicase
VVVFSQWEVMLRKAADVVGRLGVGCAVLHGGVPGKERRALLERFRDDEACRVFLSTDAGGTGLNLQSADTVVNLEVPWNPGVLEQRVARVHRMGQHSPVQVYHFVTRDSIEERVLKVLQRKRELFAGVFDGSTDEVIISGVGHQAFLDTVRALLDEAPPAEEEKPAAAPPAPAPAPADAGRALAEAAVALLEALAAGGPGLLTTDPQGRPVLQLPLTPELLQRGGAALRRLGGAPASG